MSIMAQALLESVWIPPYMIVIGAKEMASKTISIRTREGTEYNNVDPDIFLERLKREAEDRVDLSLLSFHKPIPPKKPLRFSDAFKPKAVAPVVDISEASKATITFD